MEHLVMESSVLEGLSIAGQRATKAKEKQLRRIKVGIWLYIFLLIFEGALRKWFLTPLATPLLIVRDPIAIWLLFTAFNQGFFRPPFLVKWMLGITLLAFLFTMALGHGNLFVALFGARVLLIHFPLAFLIGQVFTREDVVKVGKYMMWLVIPMTVLIFLQFYSPQSAWVNRGVGGDEAGAGFSGAMGYMRPPGTFSFTNGLSLFYVFSAPFIFFFWLSPKENINKLILILATAGLLMAIPLSISRALFFNICLVVLFTFVALLNNPKYLKGMLIAALGICLVLIIVVKSGAFQQSLEVFTNRFDTANENEGGLEGVLVDRFLGGMYSAVFGARELPVFGYGLGMGSNVGAMLLTGDLVFLVAEGEWARMIGEVGLLIGVIVILMRLYLALSLGWRAYNSMLQGDLLPWLLLSTGFVVIAQGGWSQPTNLGFYVIYCGVLLACNNRLKTYSNIKE